MFKINNTEAKTQTTYLKRHNTNFKDIYRIHSSVKTYL